jgi:chromosome segregation ATPase
MEELREKVAKAREEQRIVRENADAIAESQAKRASLQEDVAREETSLAADTESLSAQQLEHDRRVELVQHFPTETQLLKLERRLETLKSQLADATRSANQTQTAIDAYNVRRSAAASSRTDLALAIDDSSEVTLQGIQDKAIEDEALAPLERIVAAIDEMTAVCDERETKLFDLNQRYAERLEEEAALNERIVSLQQRVESELPKLDADADRTIASLTACWSSEKEALQSTYERLYAVNKEQQHHLVRGTHVKRDEAANTGHEAALSARQNTLSAQLIDARARLQELHAENTYVQRITDQLRHDARASVAAYDDQKAEVASRLQEARAERNSAEDEARKFRNLKGDLQQALQTIRDTPSGAAATS